MKTVLLLVATAFAAISVRGAADVILTNPAWLEAAPSADMSPPAFNRTKPPTYGAGKAPYEGLGYVLVAVDVDKGGRRDTWTLFATHEYLNDVISPWLAELKFSPARKQNENVRSYSWFSVIFNPASANAEISTTTPRLLAVTPAVVQRDVLVQRQSGWSGAMVPVRFTVDETGAVRNIQLDSSADEPIRADVEKALASWKFLPARREGKPVSTEVRIPVALASAKSVTLPKVKNDKWYGYPAEMNARRLNGDVTLELIVNEEGRVAQPRVIHTTHEGFNETALKAVAKWTFEPAREDGVPFPCRVQRTLSFRLPNGRFAEPGKKVSAPPAAGAPSPEPLAPLRVIYPYALLKDGIGGEAVVRYQISHRGFVDGNDVRSATNPEFGLALTAALEAARYPATDQPMWWLQHATHRFDPHAGLDPRELQMLKREKEQPGSIVGAQKLDTPLKPLVTFQPVPPFAAKGKYELGKATVECIVDEEGHVRLPRVTTADLPELGFSAVQALAAWKFEAPRSGGAPTAVRVRMPFHFEGVKGAPSQAGGP